MEELKESKGSDDGSLRNVRRSHGNFEITLLVCRQGEGHQSLVHLEGVQVVELREAFLEGLVGVPIGRELDEVHNLGGVNTVEPPRSCRTVRLEVTPQTEN